MWRVSNLVLIVVFLLSIISVMVAGEGEKPRSLALKDLAPERSPFHIPRDNSTEELWDAFVLVEKANAGDPVAQHELGLRYLVGKNFPADTVKAAYWIGKAAAQNFLPADYNYGLFLNNGWGVDWNPFEGFRHFEYAAKHGLTEAEYVYGLLFTDNLLVPRNYNEAYRWITMAADSSFAPAIEVMKEFTRRGIKPSLATDVKDTVSNTATDQSTGSSHLKPALQPIFLDLTSDTIQKPDNATLVKEAVAEGSEQLKNLLDTSDYRNTDSIVHAVDIKPFSDAAETGSPEALTIMGRFYEEGHGVEEDQIKATIYYLRAIRLESRWSPMLLWNMIRKQNYFKILKERAGKGDAQAEFAWAGLIEGGFDDQLTEGQALALLQNASRKGFSEAMVQLGLCYSTGRWVHQDFKKAAAEFEHAERLGNLEAKIRRYTIELKKAKGASVGADILQSLRKYAENGSVLAEEVLAFCYQTGILVSPNKPEAVRLYRHAAERGSRVAYNALKELYDEIRPDIPEFQF
jgi:TPR repeat protein